MLTTWRGLIWGVIVVTLLGVGWSQFKNTRAKLMEPAAYETSVFARSVVGVASDLGSVTRVKGSPDNYQLFVTNLTGTVWVFNREGTKYVRQVEPLYQVNTNWPQGSENGLTGIILSNNFLVNRQIFLLYAAREGSSGRNHVMRLTIEKVGDKYLGSNPTNIFTGNTEIMGAHQIQGGVAVMIAGLPHLLFPIGDGYVASDAHNLSREAGKLMLIQETGENPAGVRPYPLQPKIQAVGIRNAYDLTLDNSEESKNKWIYMTENGPEAFDRITHLPLLEEGKQVDLNWDGTAESLKTVLINGVEDKNVIIKTWEITVAPTDIIVDSVGRLFVNIFSSARYPNKEILMGTKSREGEWKFESIVTRKKDTAGGNVLGMFQTENGDIYFGDFFDGVLYRFTTWGDLKPIKR